MLCDVCVCCVFGVCVVYDYVFDVGGVEFCVFECGCDYVVVECCVVCYVECIVLGFC